MSCLHRSRPWISTQRFSALSGPAALREGLSCRTGGALSGNLFLDEVIYPPVRVSPTNGVAFGRNVALTLAPIVNPLKFVEGDGDVIVFVVDVAVGGVVLALNITLSILILQGQV
jgi:hypothetical protein